MLVPLLAKVVVAVVFLVGGLSSSGFRGCRGGGAGGTGACCFLHGGGTLLCVTRWWLGFNDC